MTPFEIFVVLFTRFFIPFCAVIAFAAVFDWVLKLFMEWGDKK
jgi:hypothetical protein